MLDLRLPSGLFFALTGGLLVAMGLASSPSAPLTNANVDLYAGASMLVFGAAMLALARLGKRS